MLDQQEVLMAVPNFQSMMRPVLALHVDGLPHTSAEVRDHVAEVMAVTDEDRQVPLPSGRSTRYANRVAWAVTHMAQTLLLERPNRGSPRSPSEAEGRRRIPCPTGVTITDWPVTPSGSATPRVQG
jgi:restriction endonuclease Mrr